MKLENTNATKGALFPMGLSKGKTTRMGQGFKPKARRIAEAHLASSTRGARLLAASGGDAEHAARIDAVIDDLTDHAVIPLRPPQEVPDEALEVIRLPRRPYDRDVDDELVPRVSRPTGWTTALVLGGLSWLILAGVVAGFVLLVEWLR